MNRRPTRSRALLRTGARSRSRPRRSARWLRAGRTGRSRRPRSPAQGLQLVDVKGQVATRHRYDQAEPDDHLGRRDRHHGEREDLTGPRALLAREGDQGEVGGIEHQLEREEHDQRAATEQHAERSGREQEGRDREVPEDVRPVHAAGFRGLAPTDESSLATVCCKGAPPAPFTCDSSASSRRSRRAWLPRTTPPMAAIRSTTDVISNASRWSVRKSRPTSSGLPKEPGTSAACESRPPAWRPMTTITSTSRAPAAPTAASRWRLGPPAHGASARPPR